MLKPSRIFALVLFLFTAGGCSSSTEPSPGTDPHDGGKECTGPAPVYAPCCNGPATPATCVDGKWQASVCTMLCPSDAGADADAAACSDPAPTCGGCCDAGPSRAPSCAGGRWECPACNLACTTGADAKAD